MGRGKTYRITIEEIKGSNSGFGWQILLFAVPIVNLVFAIIGFIASFKEENHSGLFLKIFFGALTVFMIAAHIIGAFWIVDFVKEIKSENVQEEMLYDSSLLEINVEDKTNIDEDSFSFKVNYKNNNWNPVVGADIEFCVYNSNGVELLKSNISEVFCNNDEECSYNYSIKLNNTEKANELYNTAYEYLEIHVTIKMLDYNSRAENYYFEDHRILKTIDISKLESDYAEAVALYNEKDYNKAIEKFSQFGNYQESYAYIENSYNGIQQQEEEATQKALEAIYQEAKELYNQGQYEKAIEKFEEIIEYKDCRDMIAICETAITNTALENSYVSAKALYSQKKYSEAYQMFYEIKDYKDSQTYITAILDEAKTISLEYANSGDYQSAFDILDSVGYSIHQNSPNYLPIFRAYAYFIYGDYKSAVSCGLTKIVIPDGTTEVSGFQDCEGLVEIVMPSTVKSVAKDAFNGCTSLTTITLSPYIEAIGQGAFSGCTELVEFIMPDTVTAIGSNAFFGCTSLTRITLSSNIKTIGKNAFAYCISLNKIILPTTLESISVAGWDYFAGEIHYAGTIEQWELVTKEHTFMATLNKTIYCSNGNIEP